MVCIMSIICGNIHAVLTISTKNTATPARRKKKKGKEPDAVVNKNKQVFFIVDLLNFKPSQNVYFITRFNLANFHFQKLLINFLLF